MPKIVAYSIAKNEILHCERWAETTKDADYRVVLDTGSTDGTVDKLRELGVTVYESHFDPFRFDMARNASLALLPADAEACLYLDMDEVCEPGFFDKVRKKWTLETNAAWVSFDTGSTWQKDKLHSRYGWIWKYPCHEVPHWYKGGDARYVNIPEAKISHQPDNNKSRGQYLGLLEMAVKENPNDARMWTYMTREYYFAQRWQDVIDSAEKQLACDGWDVERAAVCRWAGESAHNLEQDSTAWFDKGVKILPLEGEPWYGVAVDAYRKNQWQRCLDASINALERHRSTHYCYESAIWDWKAADLASISAYNLRHFDEAITFAVAAVRGNGPETERIQRNLDFFKKVKNESQTQSKRNSVRPK